MSVILVYCDEEKTAFDVLESLRKYTCKDETEEFIKIDNKYCSGTVKLVIAKETTAFREHSSKTEGWIFCFDPFKEECIRHLDNVEQSLSIEGCQPELKLLVCHHLIGNNEERSVTNEQQDSLVAWGLQHKYEIIELYPHPDEVDEEDQYGFARIETAIQQTPWSNLIMKDSTNAHLRPTQRYSESSASDVGEEIVHTVETSNAPEDQSSSVDVKSETKSNNQHIADEPTNSEDSPDDGVDLETIFQRFSDLKVQSLNLSTDERKKFAEKVTLQFWKAIGGDDEEVSGLFDD